MMLLAADTRKLVADVLRNLDTLERYVAGSGGGAAHDIKGYLAAFDSLWFNRYGERYVFAGARDAGQAKRLLKKLSKEELWRRTRAYVASNDPFYVKNRHPFGMLEKDINKFGAHDATGEPSAPRSAAVVDCKHVPPCASDIQHTRRRSEEMRR